MNRRTIGTLCGLWIVVACQGGGSPNDFGLGPSGNPPTDPGAPADPNAPPGDKNAPPFGGGSVPGTSADCPNICSELLQLCPNQGGDYNECVQECTTDIPAQCRDLAIAFVRCLALNGCNFDEDEAAACETEILAYAACLGPDPDPDPPDGEGGAGGI